MENESGMQKDIFEKEKSKILNIISQLLQTKDNLENNLDAAQNSK